MGRSRNIDAIAVLPIGDEPALWDACKNGDLFARDRLIEMYLPFARIMAAKIYAGRIDGDQDFEEYFQFATVGLIEAVERFQSDRQTLFKTFAAHRITGAVLSGLEHLSEKREQISVRQTLLAERRSSGKAALSQPEKDVFQQLAEVAIGLAIGYLLDDATGDRYNAEAVVPENQYNGLELRQLQQKIRALVDSLPQRERMVIRYHYMNHVPFGVIAETLGLTKGRVSQIHHRALNLLREAIQSVKDCDVAW